MIDPNEAPKGAVAIHGDTCDGCMYHDLDDSHPELLDPCSTGACTAGTRQDRTDVIFRHRMDVIRWEYKRAPPVGRVILILTEGGVPIIGQWRDNVGYVAWFELPERAIWMEKAQGAT